MYIGDYKSWFLESSWKGQIGYSNFKNLYLKCIVINFETLGGKSWHSKVFNVSGALISKFYKESYGVLNRMFKFEKCHYGIDEQKICQIFK